MRSSMQTAYRTLPPTNIHPSAIIAPGAMIDPTVIIGPCTTIGANVHIKKGTRIGAFVTIAGWTSIDQNCCIYSYAAIGLEAQDKKFANEKSFLQIGANTIIREFCTVHRATGEDQVTLIGEHCKLGAYSHVAHNCQLANHVALADSAMLAGHVEVGEYAYIGSCAGIHQFVKVGRLAAIGPSSKVVQDVPPYVKVTGNPAHPLGLNPWSFKNCSTQPEVFAALNLAYEVVYSQGLRLSEAIAVIEETLPATKEIVCFTSFLRSAERGICRLRFTT